MASTPAWHSGLTQAEISWVDSTWLYLNQYFPGYDLETHKVTLADGVRADIIDTSLLVLDIQVQPMSTPECINLRDDIKNKTGTCEEYKGQLSTCEGIFNGSDLFDGSYDGPPECSAFNDIYATCMAELAGMMYTFDQECSD